MTEPGEPASPSLLKRIARGDHEAMKLCIDAHGPLVWSIVLRRVRDRGAAEDLTQEIFTEIWKKAGRFDPSVAEENTFIGMIARRRAIDWNRKQQRSPALESLPPTAEFPADSPNPGVAIDREMIWRALDKLPEETRHLFTLHFEQGMTHTEITEKTGLPLGTIKTKLRRGLIEARALVKQLASAGETSTPELS